MRHKRWLLAIAVMAAIVGPSKAEPSPRSENSDKKLLEAIHSLELDADARYFSAYTDLNGDMRKEAVVYFIGPHICGSGGCPLAIFSPLERGHGYRLVTVIELTRPPIAAAKSKTKGWRDLIVFVQGGGIVEGYNMLLPFNGTSYPESPFLNPAHPFKGKLSGEALITRYSYDEGKSLAQP
jgi:hypothetical protein